MFERTFSDRITRELSGTFPHCEKRVRILAETDKYHWKEDESVWRQKRGIDSKVYEVYFDGEFVCFVDEAQGEQAAWREFIEKFRDLYKIGSIFVHEAMYKVKEAEAEAKAKKSMEVEIPTSHSPEEHIIAEVLIKNAKKNNKKVIRTP